MLDSDGIPTRSHSRLDSTTETRILGFEFPGLLFLLYHGDAQMLTGSVYHIKGSTRVKKKKSMEEFQGNALTALSTYKFFLLQFQVFSWSHF